MTDILPPLAWLAILGALQVVDWYTTVTILDNGGKELNPVVRRLMAAMDGTAAVEDRPDGPGARFRVEAEFEAAPREPRARLLEGRAVSVVSPEAIVRAAAEAQLKASGAEIAEDAPVTLIDADLFRFTEIWAAAGHPNAVFRLTPADLERLTGAPVVDIAQPQPPKLAAVLS